MTCRNHIDEGMALAGRLLDLADEHGLECGCDECLLLGGVLRDCAYKIQAAAATWHKERNAGGDSARAIALDPARALSVGRTLFGKPRG